MEERNDQQVTQQFSNQFVKYNDSKDIEEMPECYIDFHKSYSFGNNSLEEKEEEEDENLYYDASSLVTPSFSSSSTSTVEDEEYCFPPKWVLITNDPNSNGIPYYYHLEEPYESLWTHPNDVYSTRLHGILLWDEETNWYYIYLLDEGKSTWATYEDLVSFSNTENEEKDHLGDTVLLTKEDLKEDEARIAAEPRREDEKEPFVIKLITQLNELQCHNDGAVVMKETPTSMDLTNLREQLPFLLDDPKSPNETMDYYSPKDIEICKSRITEAKVLEYQIRYKETKPDSPKMPKHRWYTEQELIHKGYLNLLQDYHTKFTVM